MVRLPMCVLLAACGRFGFQPSTGDATVRDVMPPFDGAPTDGPDDAAIDDAAIDATGFQTTAVHFASAEGDYLSNGALANAADSTSGVSSGWYRITGADGAAMQLIMAMISQTGGTTRNASNQVQLTYSNCNTSPTLQFTSAQSVTKASGWVHILASWDTATSRFDFYLGETRDTSTATMSSATSCIRATQWGIGGLSGATLDADVADLYLLTGTYLDLSLAANRRKFSDAQGHPVDLGPTCANPTGQQPILCFSGPAASWQTNKGFGGGFTLHGNGLATVASP